MGTFSSEALLLIMLSTVVVITIGGFIAVYFKKKTVSSEDWAIGGRKLPPYVIVFTQFATLVGGGVLVGHVGIGYNFGLAPIMYGICGAAGCFFMAIIAKWLRENEFTTIPDILKKIYGEDNFLLVFAALMAMVVPFGWIASQITAFGKLYSSITGIGMNIIIVAVAIICVLFTLPSGFNSVAWSDFVFGVVMLGLCGITAFQAVHMGGGWTDIVSNIQDKTIISFPEGLLSAGLTTTLLWFIAATPGMMTNQMTLQRVCAADTVKNARRTLIISGILIAALEIWVVVMGVSIRSLNPDLTGEMAMGWFLTTIPKWTVALFAGFISTTIITTADSALQSVAVNFTQDIYKKHINVGASDKKLMSVSRKATVIVAILAIMLAIAFPRVMDLIIASYAYSASALLVPIYAGYAYSKRRTLTTKVGKNSMIAGLVGCFIAQMLHTRIPYAIYGILVSYVVMIITIKANESKKLSTGGK